MKKLLLVICFIFLLTSCKAMSINEIEDKNGVDDYSLVQLTDDDVIKSTSSISIISIYSNTNKGGSARIERFSGVKKLATLTKKDKITVDFEVTSGNAVLCIVSKSEILYYFEVNKENQEYLIDTNEKIYLKLAGESAKVKITYTIE